MRCASRRTKRLRLQTRLHLLPLPLPVLARVGLRSLHTAPKLTETLTVCNDMHVPLLYS